MKINYISQERLEVLRKFLESKDLTKIPMELPYIMWRAKDLYATDNTPRAYLTDSKNFTKDLMTEFDNNEEVLYFIIFDDYTGESWSIK